MAAYDPSTGQFSIQTHVKTGQKLYLSEDFADFYFIFKSKSGDGQFERIPVHKNIIGTASEVFRVMFNGSWKEKTEVEIVDASANAFREFLQFFYLSEAELTIANVAEVMNLGNKYDVTECFNVCGEFMEGNLDGDNVHEAYELAIHLEHEQLENTCTDYIERNTKAIFESESFLKLKQKNVKQILQMDSMSCSEAEVFEALMRWMKAKCAPNELTTEIVHDAFSDLLHEIRFGSMSLRELTSLDPSYGALFTLDEYREIVQMIESEQFQQKIFKKNRRNYIAPIEWDENAVIHCNRYILSSGLPYYIKNIETTSFTVNKLLSLWSLTFAKFYSYSNGRYVSDVFTLRSEITIIETSDSANPNRRFVRYNGEMDLKEGENTLRLPKPILIRPGFVYEIQMEQSPPNGCCTATKLKREVLIEQDINVRFHNDPTVGNESAARGLLWKLELSRI